MATENKQIISMQKPQVSTIATRLGYFLWHLVEMLLACCIGGIILIGLFFWGASKLGFPDFIQRFPGLSTMVIAIGVAVPMAAWMRFRHHEWRPTLEMASSSIVLGILLIISSAIGLIPASGMFPLQKDLTCPAMLIPMLFRLDLYTSSHASHQHHMHDHHPA